MYLFTHNPSKWDYNRALFLEPINNICYSAMQHLCECRWTAQWGLSSLYDIAQGTVHSANTHFCEFLPNPFPKHSYPVASFPEKPNNNLLCKVCCTKHFYCPLGTLTQTMRFQSTHCFLSGSNFPGSTEFQMIVQKNKQQLIITMLIIVTMLLMLIITCSRISLFKWYKPSTSLIQQIYQAYSVRLD